MNYIGVDVSKASLQVSDSSGSKQRLFSNNSCGIAKVVLWLSKHFPGRPHVVLEPTSTYHQPLVSELVRHEVCYSLINPSQSAAWARLKGLRAKTDRVDARMLAQFGESQKPEPSASPSEHQEQLKALERHRDWLEQEIRATRNRLEAVRVSPWASKDVIESLERTIKQLEQEAKQIEEKLRTHYKSHSELAEQVELLMSIPGIGERTALMILSEMPSVARCDSSKIWAAFCGLNPEPRESGKSRYSRLSRKGTSRVRAKLYLPAASALRFNPVIKALGMRLKQKGRSGRVRVTAAMHKLIRLCYGVLKSGRPFDPLLNPSA